MPLYAYACRCGKTAEAYASIKNRRKGPKCCGSRMTMEITGTHSIRGSFQEYRAIGRGRPLIKTRTQHRDYLRINGYEEVGNDSSAAPPDLHMSEQDIQADKASKMREVEASFAESAGISKELAKLGVV